MINLERNCFAKITSVSAPTPKAKAKGAPTASPKGKATKAAPRPLNPSQVKVTKIPGNRTIFLYHLKFVFVVITLIDN